MKNPDNEDIIIQIEETLHLFLWPNNITTCFPFPVMFYLPCADHVLLFVDDVVTSWLQTKISDWSAIKCMWSLLYRIEHVISQSVYHATSKSCMIQSNSTVYTVFFGLWYKYHDIDTCFTIQVSWYWYLLYRVTGALRIQCKKNTQTEVKTQTSGILTISTG